MIDKHGLKMSGLKSACEDTKCIWGRGQRVQISYDPVSGEVLSDWFPDDNHWKRYDDTDIITIIFAYEPMSMQEIANAISEKMQEIKADALHDHEEETDII